MSKDARCPFIALLNYRAYIGALSMRAVYNSRKKTETGETENYLLGLPFFCFYRLVSASVIVLIKRLNCTMQPCVSKA